MPILKVSGVSFSGGCCHTEILIRPSTNLNSIFVLKIDNHKSDPRGSMNRFGDFMPPNTVTVASHCFPPPAMASAT